MKIIYLGLRAPRHDMIHFPVIAINPLLFDKEASKKIVHDLLLADIVLFTSQSAIDPLFALSEEPLLLAKKVIISVGEKTAQALRKKGVHSDFIPKKESQEGIIEVLKSLPLKNKKIFCGRSSLSRPEIKSFLESKGCLYADPVLYNTVIEYDLKKRPALTDGDEIIFTSPSTVDGFIQAYAGDVIPKNLILTPIGHVTERKISECLTHNSFVKQPVLLMHTIKGTFL